MCNARTANKVLFKILSVLSLFKIKSDLRVYNPHLIIHAGYVEYLCVIPADRAEEFVKMIYIARNCWRSD